MGTIAVRRTYAVLLATLLAVVACYTAFARDAKAAVQPAVPNVTAEISEQVPEIASGVKYVKNADGSVTQVR